MGYTSESIYWVYFPNSRRIKSIQDLEFDEDNSFQEMETSIAKEPFFSFSKLEPFIDNTFNTPVRKEKLLLALLSTPSVTHLEVKDDSNQLSLSFPNDDSPPL